MTPVPAHAPAPMSAGSQAELVKSYCTGCHNDRSKAGELTLAGWNVTRAARLLGLTRDTLRYRMEKFSLAPPAKPDASEAAC